ALPLAKQLQAGLSEVDGPTALTQPINQPTTQEPDRQQPELPFCGVHSTPMTQVQGKHGPFWSCHQRNPDGSWCSFKPARSRAIPPSHTYPAVFTARG